MSATSTPSGVPGTLRVAVTLLAVQAVAVGYLTLYMLYRIIAAGPSDLGIALGVTLFAALGAVTLGLLTRALWRRRPGARGLAVALQLIVLSPAYFMINGGLAWLGWIILAMSVAIIAALMAPPTSRALGV
jgi:hypothetical protein